MNSDDPRDPELIAAWRARRAPPDLAARVSARLDRAPARAARSPWLLPAAALATVVLGSALLLRQQPGQDALLPGSSPAAQSTAMLKMTSLPVPSLSGLDPLPTSSGQRPLRGGRLPSLLDLPDTPRSGASDGAGRAPANKEST